MTTPSSVTSVGKQAVQGAGLIDQERDEQGDSGASPGDGKHRDEQAKDDGVSRTAVNRAGGARGSTAGQLTGPVTDGGEADVEQAKRGGQERGQSDAEEGLVEAGRSSASWVGGVGTPDFYLARVQAVGVAAEEVPATAPMVHRAATRQQ